MGSSVERRVVGSIDRLVDDLFEDVVVVVGFGSHCGEERALR